MTAREAWHGTRGGYTNHGCRQECCRKPWRVARQQMRSGSLPQWVKHGTLNAAESYRCPCVTCKETRRAYYRARKQVTP